MGFTISLEGAKDYTPFEGGGSDRFPFEGLTYGKIVKIDQGKAKKSGNDMLTVSLVGEEKESKGLKAKKWVPVSGVRTDGKPNALGLLDLLVSVYSHEAKTLDEAMNKARALDGKSFDSDDLIQKLTGQVVYFEVNDSSFVAQDGTTRFSSEVKNWTNKFRYQEAAAFGSHHRAIDLSKTPESAPAKSGGPGPSQNAPAPTGEGAAANGATAASTKSALDALGF